MIKDKFPSDAEKIRLDTYTENQNIFSGQHYSAFSARRMASGDTFKELQYIMTNFGGMLSKLSADMLFEEFPTFRFPDGDSDFLEAFMTANRIKMQFYESALENSYRGDVLLRLRSENGKLIAEDINPSCYFPRFNPMNVRERPKATDLAWEVMLDVENKTKGVFVETHESGKITYSLHQLDEGGKVLNELDPRNYDFLGVKELEVKTNIDELLVFHIKNFGVNSTYYGISDYVDLKALMYAISKRMTRLDMILDKHGDPILAVPEGVLDENGKIKRESFGLIEVATGEGQTAKPEYIVWDSKLESAFLEIERLVEFLFLTSETTKSAFGLDKDGGVAESGRALKFKLLRTIAKKHRKELYYDAGLKDFLYTAQKFAKANKLECDGVKMTKDIVRPEIVWQDGIINDAVEQLEVEEKRLTNGLTTTEESIARIDGITEAEAIDKKKKIQKEKKENQPDFLKNPFLNKNQDDGTDDNDNE